MQGYPIEALAPALAPPPRLGLQESSLSMPLVYVAAGPHEIGLYDVEQGRCHQVMLLPPEAAHAPGGACALTCAARESCVKAMHEQALRRGHLFMCVM